MSKVKDLEAPTGWLRDPHNKWVIHFNCKKVSGEMITSDFTLDMWGVVPNGKPMEFKSRRKVTKEESIETWNELLSSDWVKFDLDKDISA